MIDVDSNQVVTAAQFAALSPRDRGFVVYWMGSRDDQPNVPNESNPYDAGSREAELWNQGQREAVIAAIDVEE